jgi:hypothetical protein
MSPTKLAAVCVGIAAIPLIAIGAIAIGKSASPAARSSVGAAHTTVGSARNRYLAELTQVYVSRNADAASHAVRSGAELAPIPFLNRELGERGVKWRVRTTAGPNAETYDVS